MSHGSTSRWKKGLSLESMPSLYSPRNPEWNLLRSTPQPSLAPVAPAKPVALCKPCGAFGKQSTASVNAAVPPKESTDAEPQMLMWRAESGEKRGPQFGTPPAKMGGEMRGNASPPAASQPRHLSSNGVPSMRY
eukprot:scaffold25817_cov33-Tisochrysis_lutea.AAC.2